MSASKADDLVLGPWARSKPAIIGSGKCLLLPQQQALDPNFLVPLVLLVFAEPLFCLVLVMMMCNLSEQFNFEQDPRAPHSSWNAVARELADSAEATPASVGMLSESTSTNLLLCSR